MCFLYLDQNDPSLKLNNIVPEPSIPWDNVFVGDDVLTKNKYEVVALADKVLKTELLEADTKRLSRIPTNRQFFGRPGTYKLKVPQGYTATDLLAGEYRPKRTYFRRSKWEINKLMEEKAASKDESDTPMVIDESSNHSLNEQVPTTTNNNSTDTSMEVDPKLA
jgi:hypothetical protein